MASTTMESIITQSVAASSSSINPWSWKYDVYLSFRGADTRTNFTDHLYSNLHQKGIKAFVDDDGQLERGQVTSSTVRKAIEESRISLIIFSENYASSTWCLDELVQIMDCRESKGQFVVPIFYKMDPSDVRNQSSRFAEAFAAHGERFKDNTDKVLRWRTALMEAANLSPGWILNDGVYVSKLIDDIVEEISSNLLNRTYVGEMVARVTGLKPAMQALSAEWRFLLIALCLEILSICFDQASSPSKPHYALYGMLLAIAGLLTCIWELIHKGRKERVVLRRWGKMWWFYYPHPRYRPFGSLPEIYGLVGGISQCICSTVQYACFIRHNENPIKVSLWPAIFLICLGASRLNWDQMDDTIQQDD